MIIKRGYASEIRKLFGNRLLWITVFIVLTVLIGVLSVYFCTTKMQTRDVSAREQELQKDIKSRDYYLACYRYLIGEGERPEGFMSLDADPDRYYKTYQEYEFFVESQTISTDYINRDVNFAYSENRGSFAMMWIFRIMSAVLVFVGVLEAYRVFGADLDGGQIKNSVSSPCGRKGTFAGKFCYLATVFFALCLVVTVFGLSFGLTDPGGKFLFETTGGYRAVSCISIFLSNMLGVYLVMLSLGTLTAYLGMLLKRSLFGMLIVLGICLLLIGSFAGTAGYQGVANMEHAQYFPFLNLLFCWFGLFDWRYLLMLFFTLALVPLFGFVSWKKWTKKELC